MEFFATEAITATQFILEPSCLNVATAGRVVAYSQDGGATWNKGLDLTTVASMDQFVSMDFGGAGMEAPGGLAGYTNCYEGMSHLLVSQDLGSTWTPIYVLWGPPCGPDETRFEDVAMWGAWGRIGSGKPEEARLRAGDIRDSAGGRPGDTCPLTCRSQRLGQTSSFPPLRRERIRHRVDEREQRVHLATYGETAPR